MTSAAELHRPSILVVDDERAIADTLAQILNLSGYAAVPAYSGKAAIASALIWSDLVNACAVAGGFCLFGDRASSSQRQNRRRLISLIFAGRNRMVMIRRELPRTKIASPAEPVA